MPGIVETVAGVCLTAAIPAGIAVFRMFRKPRDEFGDPIDDKPVLSRRKKQSEKAVAAFKKQYPDYFAILDVLHRFKAPCRRNGAKPIQELGCKIYPITPHPETTVRAIHALHAEIARALGQKKANVIIHDVIQGGSMGVEILANQRSENIDLADMKPLKQSDYPAIVFGLDSKRRPVSIDLSRTPDVLIGGLKGKGKSTLILSALTLLAEAYKPSQLRIAIIDPKGMDFQPFAALPHLICPVVTEMDQSKAVIDWMVGEMHRRSEVIAAAKKRNLWEYNAALKPAERMPTMLLVIDELADLFITHGHQITDSLRRLAQKSRATGIHMMLATQKPDSKSIPTNLRDLIDARFAFGVNDRHSSESILGTGRTEANGLPGIGIGLLLDNGHLERVYCPYIDDDGLKKRLSAITGNQHFVPELTPDIETETALPVSQYERAYQICIANRDAGVSQTTFKNAGDFGGTDNIRAIMAELEKNGAIGPKNGNKKREIFI